MAIDYDTILNWPLKPIEHRYGANQVILYNLGVGYGVDPLDKEDLNFFYEKNLRVPPTYAVILGDPGFWARDSASGIDWVKLVLGEQSLQVHKPLPAQGTVIGSSRVVRLHDKGPGKGAIMEVEFSVTDKYTGELYATMLQLAFLRGDGGFSAANGKNDPPPVSPLTMPVRPFDRSIDLPTRPEQALIYRLNGDDNPLHVDPQVAQAAGFERPILHGLATWGLAAHAIIKSECASRPEGLKYFYARFSSPVYPGDTLRTQIWRDGIDVRFCTYAIERNVKVLDFGQAVLDVSEPSKEPQSLQKSTTGAKKRVKDQDPQSQILLTH